MKPATTRDSAARARLVAVASELFYRKGIANVGINEVIEASAVARMTLYHHFESRDALVLAVLAQAKARRQQGLDAAMAQLRSPRSKIRAAFDHLAEVASAPPYRGCVFVNAAVARAAPDDPVHRLVAEHKAWIGARFEAVARDAKWPRPALLAQQLLILWDGAAIGAYLQGNAGPVAAARLAAMALLPPTRKRPQP